VYRRTARRDPAAGDDGQPPVSPLILLVLIRAAVILAAVILAAVILAAVILAAVILARASGVSVSTTRR